MGEHRLERRAEGGHKRATEPQGQARADRGGVQLLTVLVDDNEAALGRFLGQRTLRSREVPEEECVVGWVENVGALHHLVVELDVRGHRPGERVDRRRRGHIYRWLRVYAGLGQATWVVVVALRIRNGRPLCQEKACGEGRRGVTQKNENSRTDKRRECSGGRNQMQSTYGVSNKGQVALGRRWCLASRWLHQRRWGLLLPTEGGSVEVARRAPNTPARDVTARRPCRRSCGGTLWSWRLEGGSGGRQAEDKSRGKCHRMKVSPKGESVSNTGPISAKRKRVISFFLPFVVNKIYIKI